ncbi:putative RNA-directed DNA polymerase, eukaryota, reverse transcriptase zinc-binding domain protein [Tanacetum coccineum]
MVLPRKNCRSGRLGGGGVGVGLRQGDSLSPFLFIISVEALHVSLQEAKSKGILEGVNIGSDNVNISHLQFADDALIIGKWSYENAKNLCRILRCFHLASGLKVNFSKSKLFGVGATRVETNRYIDKAILVPFGNKIRWNNSISIKINIHNWRLLNDRLPTRMNMDIRGMDLNLTRCPVCDDALETAQHLFIDYMIARNLWVMIQKWWQLADYPKDLQSLIFWSDSTSLPDRLKFCLMQSFNQQLGLFGVIGIYFVSTFTLHGKTILGTK